VKYSSLLAACNLSKALMSLLCRFLKRLEEFKTNESWVNLFKSAALIFVTLFQAIIVNNGAKGWLGSDRLSTKAQSSPPEVRFKMDFVAQATRREMKLFFGNRKLGKHKVSSFQQSITIL